MFCTNCGMKNDDTAKFCSRCGYPLTQPSQRNTFGESNHGTTVGQNAGFMQNQKQKKKRHIWISITIALAAVVVVGAAAVILLLKPFNENLREYNQLLAEGDSLMDGQRPEDACEKYEAALTLDPDHSAAYKSLSSAYVASENIAAAHKVLTTAPEKVQDQLADTIETVENQMDRTFLKTKFQDGDRVYYGVANLSGEEIIPCIYDEVSWDEDSVSYGDVIFTVQKDGYAGYMDEHQQMISAMEYTLSENEDPIDETMEIIYEGTDFKKDHAVVFKDGYYGVIDRDGNYFLNLEYDSIQYLGMINDSEFFLVSNEAGGVDVVKSTGERTDFGGSFNGVRQLRTYTDELVDMGMPYKYFSTSEKNLDYLYLWRERETDLNIEDALILDENLSAVYLGEETGQLITVREGHNYIVCGFYRNGAYEYRIYDTDFHPIVEESFENIYVDLASGYGSGNSFAARRGDTVYIYNRDGEETGSFQCEYNIIGLIDDEEGIFEISNTNGQRNFMNAQGELICKEFFSMGFAVPRGMFLNRDFGVDCNYEQIVSTDGKSGIVDYTTGEFIIPCTYENADMISSGTFYAEISDKNDAIIFDANQQEVAQGKYFVYWGNFLYTVDSSEEQSLTGLADSNGNIIIPAEYENLSTIHWNSNGTELTRYLLEKDDQWGLADADGNVIIPVGTYDSQYCQYIPHDENYLIQAQIGNQYGYIDESGEWVVCLDRAALVTDSSDSLDNLTEQKQTEEIESEEEILIGLVNNALLSAHGGYVESGEYSGTGSLVETENEAYIPEGILAVDIGDYDNDSVSELHVFSNANNLDDGGNLCSIIWWDVYEVESDTVVRRDSKNIGNFVYTEKNCVFNIYKKQFMDSPILYAENVENYVDAVGKTMINAYRYTDKKIQTMLSLYSPESGNGGLRSLYYSNKGKLSGSPYDTEYFLLDDSTMAQEGDVSTELENEPDLNKFINNINECFETTGIVTGVNTWDFSTDRSIVSALPEVFDQHLFGFNMEVTQWGNNGWQCEYRYSVWTQNAQ